MPAVFALANTAGPATQLVFVQQPTNTAAGAAIAPPVTAQLLDAAGNPARVGGRDRDSATRPAWRRIQHGVRASDAKHHRGRRGYVRRSRCRTGWVVPVADAIRGASIGNQHIVRHQRRGLHPTSPSWQATISRLPSRRTMPCPLRVSVQDALRNPVPGVVVTFAAPSSWRERHVLWDRRPLPPTAAAWPRSLLRPTRQVGSFQVTATAPGTAAPAVFSLTNVAGLGQPSGFRPAAFRRGGRSRHRAAGHGAAHRQYRQQRGAGGRGGDSVAQSGGGRRPPSPARPPPPPMPAAWRPSPI